MDIASVEQAIGILDDRTQSIENREAAARFLKHGPTPEVIGRLVQALRDDDFGVRWAAAEALPHFGSNILLPLLQALSDPDQIGDPRLRESSYHVLHYARNLPVSVKGLMEALKSPEPDTATLQEAGRLLLELEMNNRPA